MLMFPAFTMLLYNNLFTYMCIGNVIKLMTMYKCVKKKWNWQGGTLQNPKSTWNIQPEINSLFTYYLWYVWIISNIITWSIEGVN